MASVRRFIGPLIVGIAVWCASGQLTVASAADASHRLAVPASWGVLFAAIGAAALVPAWRRDPWLACPALLSTLPWWPVPLPAIALMWTGPLAWVPIAIALVVAVGVAPMARMAHAILPSLVRDPRRAAIVAGGATFALAVIVAQSVAPHTASGDEPHYLAITESLIRDGDFRIENNHADPKFIAEFGRQLKPDYRVAGKNGVIYSIHAPGLSAIVAPAYAAFGYGGAQGVVILLAAFCGALVWRIGWRATDDIGAAWFAWAAVVGSATFLLQSVTVFPDGPGALIVAACVLMLVVLDRDPAGVSQSALIAVSVGLATLPWLHTRFATLAGGFGALIAWRLWTDRARALEQRRARLIALLAIPALSMLAWLGFFYALYGTPNPTAPYGTAEDTSLLNVPGALVALCFDGQFGLFAYAPVLIVGCVGGWSRGLTGGRVSRQALGVAFIYLIGVAAVWMWWAGIPAPPARFMTAVLPVLALPMALAWSRATPAIRRGLLVLLAISLSIAVLILGVDRGGLAWNGRTAQPLWLEWLGPVVDLPRGWPSFFWALDADHRATEIPFVLHAVAWCGTFALAAVAALSRHANREVAPSQSRALFGWALALSVMLSVQLGWWMTRVSGLDPARSQLAVLSAEAAGRPVMDIGAWRIRRGRDAERAMTIRTEQPNVNEGAQRPVLVLSAVPAGTYELRFYADRPRAATAHVRIDRGSIPLRTLPILPLAEQSSVVSLPAGAANLVVATDPPTPGLRVDVIPVQVQPGLGALATSAARYDGLDVFFVDTNTFPPEPDGFWVRGGQTAEIVVVAREGRDTLHLELGNGPNANQVTVHVGGLDRTLPLRASEGKSIDLQFPGADAVLRIRIASPAGFRPSEQSASPDSRYLGVRVSVR